MHKALLCYLSDEVNMKLNCSKGEVLLINVMLILRTTNLWKI